MNILFLCYELPAPAIAGSHRVLYSVEHLAGKYGHAITLAAFRLPGRDYPDLSSHARIETVTLPHRAGWSSPGAILSALKSAFTGLNVFSRYPAFLRYAYSPEMDELVKRLLAEQHYDVIAADHPAMLRYAVDNNTPAVLLEAFALSEITRMEYQAERNWLKKTARFCYHLQTRGYARLYRRVDTLIAVAPRQCDMVLEHDSGLNIEVIPYGIAANRAEPEAGETPVPSLIITGSMSGPRNVSAVVNFCRDVYPLIKAGRPDVNLYIVGGNPDRQIAALAADQSVIVTGYVDDLYRYLSQSWVMVAPLQEGFGVKVRVLQAMSMGKPVVATSPVRDGIAVTPGENIIIADRPEAFAAGVLELLGDKKLREKIGAAARQLMLAEHDWASLSDRLNAVLESTAGRR